MKNYTNSSNESMMQYFKMMFNASSLANKADDIYELLKELNIFCKEICNPDDVTIYLLEEDHFKCLHTDNSQRNSEFFEYDETASIFWAFANKIRFIKMNDGEQLNICNTFLEKNHLQIYNPTYFRVFFLDDKLPICIFLIKENTQMKFSDDIYEKLKSVFDFIEPIIGKLYKKIKHDKKIIELYKSLHSISILYNISQTVNFVDNLERLLQIIITKALATLEAERGSLMLYDYSSNALKVRIVSGLADKKLEEAINNGVVECTKIAIGEGIAGTAFMERKPIITNLGTADPRFVAKEVSPNTKSLMCVPLIAKNEVIGVLNIANKKHNKLFNKKDLEFIESLANQAAIAIDNARLYELATKDGMTKLYIYRHFYTLLENEIRRCERYKRTMSLIMMDIDNFKRINDTYGHLTGDIILKCLAGTLQNTVRGIDIPARYGGEEFVVILPETDKKGAAAMAERIRKCVSEITVKVNDSKTISPTVSVGVAQYSEDATEAKALINAADTALYYSKHNGKNTVSLYFENGCKKSEPIEF